jgi:ADP-heptose:LPS heptosyltransferase
MKLYDFYISIRNQFVDTASKLLFNGNNLPNEKESVLVVRLDSIGDFVLWLDSLSALRELFPQNKYKLVLLGNILWRELAESCQLFDEFIFVDKYELSYQVHYRLNVWKKLRSLKWAYTIHPTFSRDFNCSDSAVRISGAAVRIGSTGDLSNQSAWLNRISNRWYTRLLPASSEPLMELERNAEFIRALGLKDFRAGLPRLSVHWKLPPNFGAHDYIVVVPGGSLAIKQWPVERFAEICERIHQNLGVTVIVCGGQSDMHLGRRLHGLANCEEKAWIEDWTGKTTLVELATIIKGARFLVGNDSSAVHIASAVGIPVFCVVGGGHFGRFIPYRCEKHTTNPMPIPIFHKLECYGCNLRCSKVSGYSTAGSCISLITVEDVWKKIAEFSQTL